MKKIRNNKKRNVIARSAQVRTSKKSVMPILSAGKIQGIFELNKRIGRSLEFFRVLRKNRDDLFFSTPAASVPQRHSEPQAKNPEKIILNNWILRFAPAPLRMTVSVLAFILFLNISTAWAACNEGDFDCNGESGSSAYCCYHVVSETNGLKNIEIYKDPAAGNNPARVGESAFDMDFGRGQDIGTVVIKEGINEVDTYAFYGANYLTSVNMPNVETIGEGAFENASSLTSVDMQNVETIGKDAFFDTSLTSVDMQNVETIGKDAFYGTSLNNVNCLGTEQECEDLKTLMQSRGATFDDSQFHVVSPTAASCTNGASIGGTCFPKRYTPAEIAELVGESNTILLYYK